MHFTLDFVDSQIITLLNHDGRMTSAEIARRIGKISPRTVNYRIDGLLERGILSVRAIVNPKALGFTVLADVLIETEPGRLREVAARLVAFEQVSYVAGATGDRDLSIQVLAHTNEELFDFVTEVIGTIGGVRRTQTHLLPLKLKDIDTWLPPASVIVDPTRELE
jgi:Lrp/AsnC family transcriptional regulator, regulator for asnA, asnC and gidA